MCDVIFPFGHGFQTCIQPYGRKNTHGAQVLSNLVIDCLGKLFCIFN